MKTDALIHKRDCGCWYTHEGAWVKRCAGHANSERCSDYPECMHWPPCERDNVIPLQRGKHTTGIFPAMGQEPKESFFRRFVRAMLGRTGG